VATRARVVAAGAGVTARVEGVTARVEGGKKVLREFPHASLAAAREHKESGREK